MKDLVEEMEIICRIIYFIRITKMNILLVVTGVRIEILAQEKGDKYLGILTFKFPYIYFLIYIF